MSLATGSLAAPRLSRATLPLLAARGITVPSQSEQPIGRGVVHVGPGAFHRVHQAWYLHQLLAHDPRWGITEVSLHSATLRDALAPQDGLYTLAVLDAEPSMQIITAIQQTLVAPEDPQAVIQLIAHPDTRLVTSTITEKGYCLSGDGTLDWDHPDIRHDLAHPEQPRSYVGYLVAALSRRHVGQHTPPNILSCDNLSHNGDKLRAAVLALAGKRSATLMDWIANEVSFPNSMVDSITPATDDALRQRVQDTLGVTDAWPVQREAFVQWVIEDTLRGEVPDLASVGVTLTRDVASFERAKLRLLNGAHSSLAYLGLLAGHRTVREAMLDEVLAREIEQLMRSVIAPCVGSVPGLVISDYIASLLQRFRNPMLQHQLSQIAWDGSQKLPFRLLDTARDLMRHSAGTNDLQVHWLRLTRPIAAWLHFIRRQQQRGVALIDPLAETLNAIALHCTGEATSDVTAFLQVKHVFTDELTHHGGFRTALIRNYALLAAVHDAPSLAAAMAASNQSPEH